MIFTNYCHNFGATFQTFEENLDQLLRNDKIFNKDLGWDNKTKQSSEIILKNKRLKFEYNFDKDGSRITGNKFKKENMSFFGDSYAFCRCSQDNQTIQHYLEKNM